MIGNLLLPARRSLENPSVPLSDSSAFELLGGTPSGTGARVNLRTSMGVSAFWRGVNLLSGDGAKLPIKVFRNLPGGGKEPDPSHPAWPLMRINANEQTTAKNFRRTIYGHALTSGNGYAFIRRAGDASPQELWILDPTVTYPVRENGMLWYVTTIQNEPQQSEMRRIPFTDVFHFRGLGFDGLVGYDVITFAKETLGLAIGSRAYGSAYFRNSARAAVVLEHPGNLTPKAKEDLVKSWQGMLMGLDNSHRTAVLEEGMKANVISDKARDAMLIESRKLDVREIANVLGVPPHKLGDESRSSFSSLEQENQSYLDEGLDPWLVQWETEANDKLLTEQQKRSESHTIEYIRAALVRADLEARFNAYSTARAGGWFSVDDIRILENMNPLPNGEGQVYLQPLNMTPVTEEPDADADEADDDDEATRSIVADSHRRLLSSCISRMIARLKVQATKAAKKPGGFVAWVEGIEDADRAVFRDSIDPAWRAAAACGLVTEDGLALLQQGYFASVRDAMLQSAEVPPSGLANSVKRMLGKIAEEYPDILVTASENDYERTQIQPASQSTS